MARIYVAINGDDVGSKIGDAIASNDHMALSKLSGSLKDSHAMVDQWVEENGGEVITSSGDEAIYILPEEAIEQIEEIRAKYQEMSGHTLTVGIGASMADASKAMIYGKINDKNQVVHYEPAIDDALSQDDIDEAEDLAGDAEAQPSNFEAQQNQHLNQEQMEDAPVAKEPLDTGDTKDFSDEDDNIEAPTNEVGEANINDNEEEADMDEYSKQDPKKMVGQVVDQEEQLEESPDEEIDPESDQIDDEMAAEDSEEIPEEETDDLTSMVEDDMSQDEEMMDDEMMDEGQPQDDIHADLKGSIIETLQIFRAHKQDLDMLATANPELHTGLISMLQHMIEMGKRLTAQESGQEQIDDQAELNEFADEFPDAESDMGEDSEELDEDHEDADEDQEMMEEEMDEHNEDMHGEDPDEDSAISDDEDPEEDATPDDEEESEESEESEEDEEKEEKPSFPPKKQDKDKLEKK